MGPKFLATDLEVNLKDWLTKAREDFPELKGWIFEGHYYNSPVDLWIDLVSLLSSAYWEQSANDDLIGRIYDYAAWCFKQPDSGTAETDLSSATAVGLIETIPQDRNVSQDLYRWMSLESFEGFENIFRYTLSDEQYGKFREEFLRMKQGYSGLSRI